MESRLAPAVLLPATALATVDMKLTQSASPTPAVAGNAVTFTLNYSNAGNAPAGNVLLTETLPAGTTLDTSEIGIWIPSPTVSGTYTLDVSSVANGGGGSQTFVVDISASLPPLTASIVNTASVADLDTGDGYDPNPFNNSSTLFARVTRQADLGVAISTSQTTVAISANLTYSVTVTNNGPSDAQNVKVTDQLPPGTTFSSIVPVSGPVFTAVNTIIGGFNTVVITTPTLAAGATASFQLVLSLKSSAVGPISNTVKISSTTALPATPVGPPSATATSVAVTSQTNLVVTANGPAPGVAGQALNYTLTLTNSGPADAQNVVLTDSAPNTTFLAAYPTTFLPFFTTAHPSIGAATGNITFSTKTLPAGATATFVVTVRANSGATSIANTATVTTSTTLSGEGPTTATATTSLTATSALSVYAVGPVTAITGGNVTYTIKVVNAGPSNAPGVILTDTLPSNAIYVSDTPANGFSSSIGSGTLTWTASTAVIPAGGSATFTLVVQAGSTAPKGATLVNTATVTSSTATPQPTVTTTTPLISETALGVTLSGPATVQAGQNVTYTLTVTNTGPGDAQNVVLSDYLPGNATYVGETPPEGFTATPPTQGSAGLITWAASSLAAGATATFTVVVTANTTNTFNGASLFNFATIGSGTLDLNVHNKVASLKTTVTTQATLSTSLIGLPGSAAPGADVTYTLTVTNTGPNAAQNVKIALPIAAGTTFVSAVQTTALSFSVLLPGIFSSTFYAFGSTLAPDASVTFSIVVQVSANAAPASLITTTATATSSTPSAPTSGNSSTATITVS